MQGSNLWLGFAIREGKNREVRNVLGHLGLTVTRLIRVSFGPFQLAELEPGAVEEVPTRVLREQLGDKLGALAAADFSAPIAATPPALREPRTVREPRNFREPRNLREPRKGVAPLEATGSKAKERKSPDHAWRAHEADLTTKKLRRKFHGDQRDAEKRQRPAGELRSGLLQDRKGRPVAVERYGQPPAPQARQVPRQGARQERREEPGEKRPSKYQRAHGRNRSPDRASGPRPRQPRGRK